MNLYHTMIDLYNNYYIVVYNLLYLINLIHDKVLSTKNPNWDFKFEFVGELKTYLPGGMLGRTSILLGNVLGFISKRSTTSLPMSSG